MLMSGPKLGRGTLYHMIARGIFLGCDFIIHVYIARRLGPEVYGLCGVVLALLAIISQPLNIGLNQSVSKYVAEDHARTRAILYKGMRTQMVLVAVLMVIFIGFSEPVASLLRSTSLENYMLHAALILPGLGALTILMGIYNGTRSFGKEALVLSSYPLVRTLVAISLIYLGYSVGGVIWGFIIGITFSVIIATLLLKAPGKTVDFDSRKLRVFAIPVFILGLARASYFLFVAMGTTIFPSISESVSSRDDERTASYISQGIRYLMMMALPVACLAAASGTNLISLIFSKTYSEGGSALAILMFGFTLLALFSILTTILMAGGRPNQALAAGVMLLPVNFLLNFILISRFQIIGAALATSLTSLFGVGVASVLVWREFNTLWEMRSLLNITVSSALIFVILRIVSPLGYWLIPWAIFSVMLYGLLLFILGELRAKDWMVFRGIVHMAPAYTGIEGQGGGKDGA
jgi:stage V sporulation protein B